jgi:hypothetical protein
MSCDLNCHDQLPNFTRGPCSVLGEQIRLASDRVDQFGCVADPGRRTGELAHALGRRPCLASGSAALRADSWTWRLIPVTEEAIFSLVDATGCTFVEASSDAAATVVAARRRR